jgi:hypothetical protein
MRIYVLLMINVKILKEISRLQVTFHNNDKKKIVLITTVFLIMQLSWIDFII